MHMRQNGGACLPLPAFMSDTCKEGIYPPCSKRASAPSSRVAHGERYLLKTGTQPLKLKEGGSKTKEFEAP